jgi:hypothetical protein
MKKSRLLLNFFKIKTYFLWEISTCLNKIFKIKKPIIFKCLKKSTLIKIKTPMLANFNSLKMIKIIIFKARNFLTHFPNSQKLKNLKKNSYLPNSDPSNLLNLKSAYPISKALYFLIETRFLTLKKHKYIK